MNPRHESAANESPDRRIGFGLMAMATRVRSTTGRRSATLLCGEDAYGHWDLDPEPAGDRDPVIWDLMHQADAGYRDRSIRQEADTADRGRRPPLTVPAGRAIDRDHGRAWEA